MFRALGKSKIAFVLAILFGISLFFFKSGSRYSNLFNSDTVVAKVSGTPISTTKFNRTMQININQFNQMLGKKLDKDEIRAFQIQSLALGTLINNAVFEDEFKKNKYLIDEKVVAKITKKRFPNLYDKNNKLIENNLNAFLQNQGLKIDDLVNIIEYEIRADQFNKLFFDINYPSELNRKIENHNSHQREIEYILLNLNKIDLNISEMNNINKETKEVLEHYNNNINNYMTKEKRDISFIIIDKNNFTNQFKPSKESITSYYNKNKNMYLDPEKRDFLQFNFKKIEDANNFLNKVKNFELEKIKDFANNNNIIFNEFEKLSKEQILESLSNEIFNLKIGEISNIIETPLAKHILIVQNVTNQKQKSLSEVYKNIEKTLLTVELNNYFSDLKTNISSKILDGQNLKNIASDFKLKLDFLKNFENGSQELENDSVKNEILKNGFISNKDFVSDVIDFNENLSYIYNVDNIYSSKAINFDTIYEKVIEDFKFDKKKNFISDNFNNNIKNKNYLYELSSKYDQDIIKIEIQKNSKNFPDNFIKEIYANQLNENILFFDIENLYIAKINSINIPNKDTSPTEELYLDSDLKNAFGSEIIKNKNISTNDELLNALLNQY